MLEDAAEEFEDVEDDEDEDDALFEPVVVFVVFCPKRCFELPCGPIELIVVV